jgi:hypothetical protein
MRKPTADFKVEDNGSVVLIVPMNRGAREWVDENVYLESWQWLGGGFACEPRMVGDLLAGIAEAGFIYG